MENIFNLLEDRLKEDIYKHIDDLLSFEISALNVKMGGFTEENWDNLSKEDRKNYIIATLMVWNSRLEIKKLKGESEEEDSHSRYKQSGSDCERCPSVS